VPIGADRRVAVESYGDPAGIPVFFYHGWPSSRWQGALADETARELGIHLLSVDRPGVGESDLHVGRELRDWPPVLAALADHFQAEKFYVWGVSGGGPYVLASAWALPERIKAAAVVSGAPPLAGRSDVSTLMPVYQALLSAYRRHPEFMRRVFRALRPVAVVRPPDWLWRALLYTLPECDREGLNEPGIFERAWQGYHGAWIGHPDGVFHDARIYAEPWGFDPAEIRVPVRIWHGRDDRNFHWPLAEELAARIPNSHVRFIDHEGHYSLIVRHHREILTDLLKAGEP
jgi:pimeloyl-ACP methyl ester carboxylesterase